MLDAIRQRMHADGHFLVPVRLPEGAADIPDISHATVGGTVTACEDLHFVLGHIRTNDGREWLAAFTSDEENKKGAAVSAISCFIGSVLSRCRDMEEAGIILDPWGRPFRLMKELINMILDADRPRDGI